MKEFINKYLTRKNRNIIAIVIIVLGVIFLINYSFFEPTYINQYIATKIYDTPANSYFDDDNFYNCVVDAYNKKNGTSLAYTTNLSDNQLKTITYLNCNNRKNIVSAKGIEKLTSLTKLDVTFNQLTSLDVSKNTAL